MTIILGLIGLLLMIYLFILIVRDVYETNNFTD